MRLAIAEKGLQCKEYDVSLPLSEHNEPWFMRLNPAGEVPVLVHGDRVVCDPTQIMDYLEETFNDGKHTKLSCNPNYADLNWFSYYIITYCINYCTHIEVGDMTRIIS